LADWVRLNGHRPFKPTIVRALRIGQRTLNHWPRFMAAYSAVPANPQRPGRHANATEDQAIAYLTETVRRDGHRPSKVAICRALRIATLTLNAWPRFVAAHSEAPPNPRRHFGWLKPPAPEQQPPPAASAHDPRDNWTEYPLSISVNQERRLVRRTGFDKQVSFSASPVCWHILSVVLSSAPDQAPLENMLADYPGEDNNPARAMATQDLNRRLRPIRVRVHNRTLVLLD
jgi:hypothetical protein